MDSDRVAEIIAPQSRGLRRESIEHNTAPVQKTTVEDHGSKTVGLVALIIGSVALGAVLVAIPLVLLLMDSRTETVAASVRASVQEQISDANSTAKEARSTAKVTEDKLYELRDALNSKGMNLPKLDGH